MIRFSPHILFSALTRLAVAGGLVCAGAGLAGCDTLTHRLVGEPRPDSREAFLLRPLDRIDGRSFWEGENAATSAAIFDVIRNEAGWQQLWAVAVGTPAPGPLPPNTMALAGFLGRRERSGHALTFETWEPATAPDGTAIIQVRWRERLPPADAPAPVAPPDLGLGDAVLPPPSPYLIRLLYASARPVAFVPAPPQ